MASLPFTLAALATSAVSGLAVTAVRAHDSADEYAAAIIDTDQGELIVRVPRTAAAEILQSAELLGLAALGEGPRSQLTFAVPEILGMTRAGDTRAVVSTYFEGSRFETDDLRDDALLLEPIAETLASIHSLPRSIAQSGGLPVREARDLRVLTARLVERAEQTRLVPATVLRRWRSALTADEVWDFAPTIVHGTFDADQLLVHDDRIIAVLGWSELSVGDPATDLGWLLAAEIDVFEGVLGRYAKLRSSGSLSHIRTRAALYHELEVAKWLLHGVDVHDDQIVEDAVSMLDRLVGAGGLLDAEAAARHHSAASAEEVAALLEETPDVVDHLSVTAAYEALDEDRMFGVEPAFLGDDEALDAERIDAEQADAEQADAEQTDAEHTDIEADDQTSVADDAHAPERSAGSAQVLDTGQIADLDTQAFEADDLPESSSRS